MQSRADRWFLTYRVVGAVFGWVWLLTIPLTLGLIVYAAFFGGAWKYVLFSMIGGSVGKWLLRGFNDHSERVAVEAYLTTKGASKEVAGAIWLELYKQGGSAAARQVFELDDAELARLCQVG
jgi:hypothetical protein